MFTRSITNIVNVIANQGIEYFGHTKMAVLSLSPRPRFELICGAKVLVIENGDKTRIVAENQPGLAGKLYRMQSFWPNLRALSN